MDIGKKDKLARNVSGFSAYVMVVGTVIGTGIFFKPQAIFAATGTASLGLLAWVVGCLLGLAGGLIIAEIGALIPETGGLMTYLEKIYSKSLGFMVAWTQMVVFYPIRKAASAVVFGIQAVALFGLGTQFCIPLAILLTVYLFFINLMGNKVVDRSISIATILKFIPIILIVVFGLFLNSNPQPVQILPLIDKDHPLFQALSLSVMGALYATDGWINITNIAGEIKNPQRNIPRAIVWGLLTVTATYLIINIAFLMAMTPEQLAHSATAGSDAASILMGDFGNKIVAVGILISIIGSHTGFSRAAWRIPYALSLRNWLPFSNWFSYVSKKAKMPVNSGIFVTVLTLLATVFLSDFNLLTDIGTYAIWVFYTLAFIGVILLRKKWPQKKRSYRVPFYPVIPIIGILGGAFVLVSTTVYQPLVALLSLLLGVIGLPIYLFKERQNIPLEERTIENEA